MRRFATLSSLALVLGALFPAAARATHDTLIGFTGMGYEAAPDGGPDPTPGQVLAIGDSPVLVGHVTAFADALLPHVDLSTYEYTVVISGGVVTSRSTYSTSVIATVLGARLRVYEDSIAGGTPGVFTADPPNADVPATFMDGTLGLGAPLGGLTIAWVQSISDGGCSNEDIEPDEGSLLPYVPPRQSDRIYRLGATFSAPQGTGYLMGVTGSIEWVWVLPVERTTWGRIKRAYR